MLFSEATARGCDVMTGGLSTAQERLLSTMGRQS